MPANVDKMFSVREMPWHREGQVLEDYPQSWAEAKILAGLNWEPIESPVYTLTEVNGQPVYTEVPDWRSIVRSDNGRVLACTHDAYQVMGHDEFGEILEATLKQGKNTLKFETGGVLEGGRKVWMLVKMDEPVKLRLDKSLTMPYLAITSRHDAQGGCSLRATAVRIVCANTFGAAEMEGNKTGTVFTFVHRGNWRDRMEEARAAVTGARQQFTEYAEIMDQLIGVKVTTAQTELFVKAFIPAPPEAMITDRVMKNIETARDAVRGILASDTVAGAGIGGTAYGLVQAGGEYLDHVRTARTWESKLNRTIITGNPFKAKAVKLALEAAKA